MAVDDNDAGVVVCANPDCRVADTGRCVDGFELDACGSYGHDGDEENDSSAVNDEELVESGVESIQLAVAGTLTPSEASGLLRAGEARVIAILGPPGSGKTSLVASLYDLFQVGPVEGIEFSRSRTLHAFESACHDARSASRRTEPDMNRTPLGGVRFYHLEIGGGDAGECLALIMGDRSGEEYREIANDASSSFAFSEVVRADSLTVLVDGERLLDTGARHNVRSEIVLMLQALLDGDALQLGSRLALVLTKLDAVQESGHAQRAVSDFDSLFNQLRRRFGEALSAIEAFQIAASPKTDRLPRGTGVPQLLSFWLKPAVTPAKPPVPILSFDRAFIGILPLDEPSE